MRRCGGTELRTRRIISSANATVTSVYNAKNQLTQTTEGGTVAKYYEYDAFGNEINPDSSDTNPYRYCGEYFDTESGTIYLRARYYNPAHGRFTQRDPARDGLNWYAYCANNPILFVDPWGNEYYIIYSKTEKVDFEKEALSDKQNLIDNAGIDDSEIILIAVASGDELVDAWNSMGVVKDSDGNVTGICDIDSVIINTHADPMKLIVDNHNKSTAIASVSRNPNEKTLDNSLENKNIKGTVIIYGCNAGHLDYRDNVASVIAKKSNGAVVIASDGTVTSKGHSLYSVMKGTKSRPDSMFCRHKRQVGKQSSGWKRTQGETYQGEGWVVYRDNGRFVTRRVIDNEVRKLYPCYAINILY